VTTFHVNKGIGVGQVPPRPHGTNETTNGLPKSNSDASSTQGDGWGKMARGAGSRGAERSVRIGLQFRAEAFNLANHPTFGPINARGGGSYSGGQAGDSFAQTVGTATFGRHEQLTGFDIVNEPRIRLDSFGFPFVAANMLKNLDSFEPTARDSFFHEMHSGVIRP
jgi:hypothetical protein